MTAILPGGGGRNLLILAGLGAGLLWFSRRHAAAAGVPTSATGRVVTRNAGQVQPQAYANPVSLQENIARAVIALTQGVLTQPSGTHVDGGSRAPSVGTAVGAGTWDGPTVSGVNGSATGDPYFGGVFVDQVPAAPVYDPSYDFTKEYWA